MTELSGQLDQLGERLRAMEEIDIGTGGGKIGGGILNVLSENAGSAPEPLLDAVRMADGLRQADRLPAPITEFREGPAAEDPEKGRDISVTIPINVDGMELGRAAIKSINAVTKASGTLMLEI